MLTLKCELKKKTLEKIITAHHYVLWREFFFLIKTQKNTRGASLRTERLSAVGGELQPLYPQERCQERRRAAQRSAAGCAPFCPEEPLCA